MKAGDFGKYLQSLLFEHIPADQFWGCKIPFIKTFTRSDLVLKKWNHMIMTPNIDSHLRDAQLFIVRDYSKTMRLELTDEELTRYANPAFLDHVKKKAENAGVHLQHKNHDALFEAASNRKVDWNNPKGSEKGVSIKVGIEAVKDAEEKEKSDEGDGNDGGVWIEELF